MGSDLVFGVYSHTPKPVSALPAGGEKRTMCSCCYVARARLRGSPGKLLAFDGVPPLKDLEAYEAAIAAAPCYPLLYLDASFLHTSKL